MAKSKPVVAKKPTVAAKVKAYEGSRADMRADKKAAAKLPAKAVKKGK